MSIYKKSDQYDKSSIFLEGLTRLSKSELFCANKFFVEKFCASKRAQKTLKKLRKGPKNGENVVNYVISGSKTQILRNT